MVFIEHADMRKNLVEWAEYFGLPYKVLQVRYSRHGDNLDKLFAPYKERTGCALMYGQKLVGVAKKGVGKPAWSKVYFYRGKEQTLWKWSQELGIAFKVLEMRVYRGKRGEALFVPAREYVGGKKYKG
jgi:hypothetical protein